MSKIALIHFKSEHNLYQHFSDNNYYTKIGVDITNFLYEISIKENRFFNIEYVQEPVMDKRISIKISENYNTIICITNFIPNKIQIAYYDMFYANYHKDIENIVLNTIRKKKFEAIKQIE